LFTQKEQQKTFINRVVGNQIFLNTRYKRTLFFLDKIPIFSLKELEIDSIVYELLFDLQASPNKKKNGSDWEGLAFTEKIFHEEWPLSGLPKSLPYKSYFYKQIGDGEDHKGRFQYNSASWLFWEIDYIRDTFLVGSNYLGDGLTSTIFNYMDEGYEEGIISILKTNRWHNPTRLISGKIKDNSIDPKSCKITEESLTWYYLPPSIGFDNIIYGLKSFFNKKWETHY
jgi:hypothetical protein|tara:strand:- start:537 stop:1217 length:681 start_codon:yes stop_codon:yes gene_type:complete